jgi:hypothetical protein
VCAAFCAWRAAIDAAPANCRCAKHHATRKCKEKGGASFTNAPPFTIIVADLSIQDRLK